jgi:DNA-binding MarR family transcriptional regulator
VVDHPSRVLKADPIAVARFLPVGKFGEPVQVHPASMTNATHRLAAVDLVSRLPNPKDCRIVSAAITQQGGDLAAVAATALNTEVFNNVGVDSNDRGISTATDTVRAVGQRHSSGTNPDLPETTPLLSHTAATAANRGLSRPTTR